ncbi:hypothetical protein UXN93_20960 [Enterobacter hormaechei]
MADNIVNELRPFAREPLSGTSGRVAVGNDDHWKRGTISAVDL